LKLETYKLVITLNMKNKITIINISSSLKNNRNHYNIILSKKNNESDLNSKKSSLFAEQTLVNFSEN